MADPEESSSNSTVLILVFCLLGLIVLLIFLYKTLNKETNGEYTIRNMVYKEGGVRDQLRGVALALGTRLGVQLWPHDDMEMQEVTDEEAQLKKDDSQVSESEEKDGQAEEEDSDTSDDESHLEGPEAGEEARLNVEPESKEKEKEKENEEKEKEEKEDKMETERSGGTELLISLNQFSGSAIWSEEQVSKVSEVTPL